MPMRRFLAYFFAMTAGSTVIFASFLSAPSAAGAEAALQEAREDAATASEAARLFQEIREHPHHKFTVKR